MIANEEIRLGKNWGWVLTAGILNVILGVVLFSWPVATSVALTYALGAVLLASGVINAIHAFQLRNESGTGWRVLLAIASLAAGALILRYPGAGMVTVAIAIAFSFFMNAAAKGTLALNMRPSDGWGWLFFSATVSACLGLYVMMTLPVSALWIPGIVVGVDLVVYGVSLIGLSMGIRKLHRGIESVVQPIVKPRRTG